jgi:hypothetical protein
MSSSPGRVHLGIPARYASGYFFRADGVVEQEAGHAWAEAKVPDLGWVGFDPANGISTGEAHVRVAIGLDYLGAAPIRGSRTGGGSETLTVKLRVEGVPRAVAEPVAAMTAPSRTPTRRESAGAQDRALHRLERDRTQDLETGIKPLGDKPTDSAARRTRAVLDSFRTAVLAPSRALLASVSGAIQAGWGKLDTWPVRGVALAATPVREREEGVQR